VVKDLSAQNKIKETARRFRNLVEKFDIDLEQKDAEIYFLKKEIEKLKNNKSN
jgi:hypothetical protein